MRTWFHERRARRQKSNLALSLRRTGSTGDDRRNLAARQLPDITIDNSPIRLTPPAMASRMSIERYLKSPFSDEPASAPAINAAIQRHIPRDWIDSPATSYHSRETSVDVHSDGRPIFSTTASMPGRVDTSYRTNSGSRIYRSPGTDNAIGFSNTRWLSIDSTEAMPARRPPTSGTVGPIDLAKEWTDRVQRHLPRCSLDTGAYDRTKTQDEIYKIQEKARELEFMMQQFMSERSMQNHGTPRLSVESVRARMIASPKLQWILGDDAVQHPGTVKPELSRSATSNIPDSPMSSGKDHNICYSRPPRKSKSSSALDSRTTTHHNHATLESDIQAERQPRNPSTFFCTFCQKRFYSRVEWLKHEQITHMPKELWVCCPRTGEFPKRCPFCERAHPSPAHLADHNYLSCQEKPLVDRTFSRKDHFLQHISQVHKVNPEQKQARLTELEHAWRHSLPLDIGHQALHCGFCGQTFESYQERTEHVRDHFMDGADMMSWWKDRISHDILPNNEQPVIPKLPHQCAYCERTFKNLAVAQKVHPTCTMWSCSFMPGLQYTMYPKMSRVQSEAVCCYCNGSLARTADGKVNGTLLKEHMAQHNFRTCDQKLFFSGQSFRQHLQDSHRSLHDSTLFAGWTLLLESSRRQVPSIFQHMQKKANRRHSSSDTDLAATPSKNKKTIPPHNAEPKDDNAHPIPMNFMELTEPRHRAEPNKLRRKQSAGTSIRQSGEEPRPSLHLFAPPDTAHDVVVPPMPYRPKPEKCITCTAASGVQTSPLFYRKRFDASTRNQIYMAARDETVPDDAQHVFRRIQGSVFGGLVLHSSLVGSVPALMTNSVDIYALR